MTIYLIFALGKTQKQEKHSRKAMVKSFYLNGLTLWILFL